MADETDETLEDGEEDEVPQELSDAAILSEPSPRPLRVSASTRAYNRVIFKVQLAAVGVGIVGLLLAVAGEHWNAETVAGIGFLLFLLGGFVAGISKFFSGARAIDRLRND